MPGIGADCPGACGTCHVYVDESWVARLPERADLEVKMLKFAVAVQPMSRLSCRLVVSPKIDGVTMRVSESRH